MNKTVNMHDNMLHKTEKMLEAQTGNLTKLENQVDDLKRKLGASEDEKANMEKKLGEVMVNILEVRESNALPQQWIGLMVTGTLLWYSEVKSSAVS